MLRLTKLCIPLVMVILAVTSCKKEHKTIDLSVDLINTNNLIREIIAEINENYADDVAREKLEVGAINGMLGVLDEHSVYISQDEFDAFNRSARGSFLGVGVEIKQIRDGIEVSSVIDESPAATSGLKVGDIITQIDARDVSEMTLKEIISKLSSDSKLKVNLFITRNKTEKFAIELKKSVVQIQSVKLNFINDIAIIKISYFNEYTLADTSNAIKKLNKKSAKAVILDLRNNPGGILEQAISVSDLFLSNKKIVEFKSRNIDESKVITSDETDLLNGRPMAVLIDSGTASGGELVAAALGENQRAVLIGKTTYGKGSLQTVIPIPGRGAIKLTTAYFISPNGNAINQHGVTPDIEIDEKIKQGQSAKKRRVATDPVILRAIDLLHGISALNEIAKNNSDDSTNLPEQNN